MIICFTGHRPNKLPGGYNVPNKYYIALCSIAKKYLLQLKPEKCISGMAQGWDIWMANLCINMKIPLIAAVPCQGQEKMWPEKSQKIYRRLLEKSTEVVMVHDGPYSAKTMLDRDEWMVDRADKVLALYNGDTFGGTYHTVKYARKQNKDLIIINPNSVAQEVNNATFNLDNYSL